MADILFVAGRFDDRGGKPSGYMGKIAALDPNIELHNGGNLDRLPGLIAEAHRYRAIWWMPEIDNSVPKFVKSLKDQAPRSVLVISKNNSLNKYQPIDLVGRMLAARANLSLIVDTGAPFHASVLDPLGNAFAWREPDVNVVGRALLDRTHELLGFTRMGSRQIGEALASSPNESVERFLELVRGYADTFHQLVHGVNPSRFLGNASYRCTKGGFPAFIDRDHIFVSRRNIDKRQISTDGFVAVEPEITSDLLYYGDAKPSVDAPLQRALFNNFRGVKFMLHSHTYIDGAPFTKSRVPCGALEEVKEIHQAWATNPSNLRFNLTGHGCLIMSDQVRDFEDIPFISRPLPEIVETN